MTVPGRVQASRISRCRSRRLLFDLDGTLVDSVYQHVIAWQEALAELRHPAVGVAHPPPDRHERRAVPRRAAARDRRPAGRRALAAARGRARPRLPRAARTRSCRCPAPASCCTTCTTAACPFAIATSGARRTAASAIEMFGLPADVPVVTRDLVERAKPDPHLFLAAARLLGVAPEHSFVVGDSVWDLLAAQRAGALGIGLLSGGYGREELERAGAYRVYADPAEMLTRLEEVGVRPEVAGRPVVTGVARRDARAEGGHVEGHRRDDAEFPTHYAARMAVYRTRLPISATAESVWGDPGRQSITPS